MCELDNRSKWADFHFEMASAWLAEEAGVLDTYYGGSGEG